MKRNTFIKSIFGLPFLLTSLSFKKEEPIVEKVTFTPEMLSKHNYGLFIINTKVKDVKRNPSYAATVSWKLGYMHTHIISPEFRGGGGEKFQWNTYGRMNFLTDGWFHTIGNSSEEVCEWLNNNPYGETFRLLTKAEVLYLIQNRQQGFL